MRRFAGELGQSWDNTDTFDRLFDLYVGLHPHAEKPAGEAPPEEDHSHGANESVEVWMRLSVFSQELIRPQTRRSGLVLQCHSHEPCGILCP